MAPRGTSRGTRGQAPTASPSLPEPLDAALDVGARRQRVRVLAERLLRVHARRLPFDATAYARDAATMAPKWLAQAEAHLDAGAWLVGLARLQAHVGMSEKAWRRAKALAAPPLEAHGRDVLAQVALLDAWAVAVRAAEAHAVEVALRRVSGPGWESWAEGAEPADWRAWPEPDLVGWEAIAARVGQSVAHTKKLATGHKPRGSKAGWLETQITSRTSDDPDERRRMHEPSRVLSALFAWLFPRVEFTREFVTNAWPLLPVRRVGGVTCAHSVEVDEWLRTHGAYVRIAAKLAQDPSVRRARTRT